MSSGHVTDWPTRDHGAEGPRRPLKGIRAMEDSIWGYRKDDGTPIHREDVRDMYRDMLNECYEPVKIGYGEWGAGEVLEEMDPIAFRCGVSDYWDSLLTDGEYVEDEADVDSEDEA